MQTPGEVAMAKMPISSDSHITEPPNCYIDHIEQKYKDTAPRVVNDARRGEVYVIDGIDIAIPMGLIAAAGKDPSQLSTKGAAFADLHRGGWDPKARAADQDVDGVGAEIIFPSVGMMLANHPDLAYKRACFDAYNRWLQGFCEGLPNRLFGMPQLAMETPEAGIADLVKAKAMGFKGVMMPGRPGHEDYHHRDYDAFYEAAVDLELPICFHILTSGKDEMRNYRGPKINGFLSIIRGNQDIIGTFVFGGVFQRHPKLKLVCVEADAGWAPHYMYRMDHAYKRHRYWMKCEELERLPSDYFRENVYMTFQDDWTAFQHRADMNIERLMWANDFPHSDATWPHSQELLAKHTAGMTEWERDRILHEDLNRRDRHDHPHRHGEHGAGALVGPAVRPVVGPAVGPVVGPAVGPIAQQMERADRADHQRRGQVGGQHHVHEPVGEGRVEDDRPPVQRHELARLVDVEPGRRLHPGIDRENPEGRDHGADRYHDRGREMQSAADALHAEQHDAEEAGLQEEGGQHLVGHERPEHRPGPVGKHRPVGAELVGHDHAGHHAHAEGEREDLQPVLEQGQIDGAAGAQPQPFEHGEIAGQPDRERREHDVERHREGELHPGQQDGVHVREHR